MSSSDFYSFFMIFDVRLIFISAYSNWIHILCEIN
jgi:hypothetical protein